MFLIPCPNCGERDASEFVWHGEVHPPKRDAAGSSDRAWAAYLYFWDNPRGMTREWCHHHVGCGDWFIAERDTAENRVEATWFAERTEDAW